MEGLPKKRSGTEKILKIRQGSQTYDISMRWAHTIVVGSGASGLNAAVQLRRNGIQDILIITEGLDKGTSINTGSDKQTYYKLSIYGSEKDSPVDMAESYFKSGAMHGDIALVESSLSARAFMNLVNLGVPFPRDAFGQFVGYKTDHDPRQRATSIGPYTSKEMCLRLIDEVKRQEIPVLEGREVIQLVTDDEGNKKRIIGFIALDEKERFEIYGAENIIFAVGGPGGLYQTSVYPEVHNGAIGLALMVGAEACNLPESQYGLASIKFRWNVSGTYMQVIPRIISRAADGISEEREFLKDYFENPPDLFNKIFLKGYQWPFDAAKAIGGSSIIDILVYIENVEKGRRVYLDYRENPDGFSFEKLPDEAREYLLKSKATQRTPLERLKEMNQPAIDLYRDNGIDLSSEPLEIAVCAQHNNGGLSANIWWESTNIDHLFPVGEVNGSHGVNRPGGSALNSGQVGGFRAAEYIANKYSAWTIDMEKIEKHLIHDCQSVLDWVARCPGSSQECGSVMDELQHRMSFAGAHIRNSDLMVRATHQAEQLVEDLRVHGCRTTGKNNMKLSFRARQLAFAHLVYLDAIKFSIENHVGSRGSSIVLSRGGQKILEKLDEKWHIEPEDPTYRKKILYSSMKSDGKISHTWRETRPIPDNDLWFEIAWAAFRQGDIYHKKN